MSWPHIAIYLIVIGIGLPAALRNPTAGALVAAWALGEATWLLTGNSLPLNVYFMADIAVLAVMCVKAIMKEGSRTYPTMKAQLAAFWRALTLWDKLIAGGYIFAAWPVYVIAMHDYYRWWALYWIVVAQILLAGCEAIQSWLGVRKGRVMSKPPGGSGLAYARGGGRV